jgi:hypothetical protein
VTYDGPDRASSDAAAKGTAFATGVETGDLTPATLLPESDRDDVLCWLDRWHASPLAALPWRHEAAMAWHPVTGVARDLPRGKHREYVLEPGEVAGTADLLAVDDERVIVADHKTGRQTDLQPASENMQLRTLALFAARTFHRDRASVAILHVTEDGVREDWHELDLLDLDEHAAWLRERLSTPQPPVAGEHCRWCPAHPTCPTTQAIVTTLPDVERFPLTVVPDSPEHAAWILSVLPRLEAHLEDVRAGMKRYADTNNGIPMADGRVWSGRVRRVVKPELRGTIGKQAQEYLAAEGLDAAIDRNPSTTWAAIKRLAGSKAKEVKKHLEEMGAITAHEQTRYEARRAGADDGDE